MKLKKHGAFVVEYVISFVDERIERSDFDMDYSGYLIEHFASFEKEHPRLAARFVRTIDAAYDRCSWMTDNAFRAAIADALDEFFEATKTSDIY